VIDRGEALLAVVGMRSVVDRSLKYITLEQRERARRLETRVQLLAAQLVNGTLTGAEPPAAVEYDDLLAKLTEPPTPEELEQMIRSLPGEDHDDAAAFLDAAGRCYRYLQANLPIMVKRNLLGAENLRPSDLALTTFEFLLEVIDQPMAAFDLMSAGALLRSQGDALKACYPTLHQSMVDAISGRLAGNEYDGVVCLSLSALTGAPYQDPQVTAALATADQAQALKEQAARQQQPQHDRVAEMGAPPSARP
jgi:hypothetical protein